MYYYFLWFWWLTNSTGWFMFRVLHLAAVRLQLEQVPFEGFFTHVFSVQAGSAGCCLSIHLQAASPCGWSRLPYSMSISRQTAYLVARFPRGVFKETQLKLQSFLSFESLTLSISLYPVCQGQVTDHPQFNKAEE